VWAWRLQFCLNTSMLPEFRNSALLDFAIPQFLVAEPVPFICGQK
jgi:hypothetical protein